MINRYPPWSCRCLTVACRHSAVPRPLGRCILHMILFSINLWRAMSSLSPVLYWHDKWNCPSSHVDPALSCSCRAGGCHDTVAWYKTQCKKLYYISISSLICYILCAILLMIRSSSYGGTVPVFEDCFSKMDHSEDFSIVRIRAQSLSYSKTIMLAQ